MPRPLSCPPGRGRALRPSGILLGDGEVPLQVLSPVGLIAVLHPLNLRGLWLVELDEPVWASDKLMTMTAQRTEMIRRRKTIGLSQEELALRVGVDPRTLRRWESGQSDPQPWHRPTLAAELGATVDELDELLFPRGRPASAATAGLGYQTGDASRSTGKSSLLTSLGGQSGGAVEPAEHLLSRTGSADIEAAWSRWRETRRLLNDHRGELSAAALRLHGLDPFAPGVLINPNWLPDSPVPPERLNLTWAGRVPAPRIAGGEQASAGVRPPSPAGGQYKRYSQAIKALERPSLFENRSSYRLMSCEWGADGASLEFGHTTYFDMLDTCEAVAHEFAAAWQETGCAPEWLAKPTAANLELRNAIGDPFDLSARALLPSIDTITLRREAGGSATFYLHERSAASVAVAGSTIHVMPAGVFQPSSVASWDHENDFDVWRNIMREFGEEFLGLPEADGSSGEPIDYARTEPYRSLERARMASLLRVFCFGIVLDPLTLAAEIITAVVLDHDVFDDVFAHMVPANSEGAVITPPGALTRTGIPFTEATLQDLRARPTLAPAAAACLHLAWLHRALLLDW